MQACAPNFDSNSCTRSMALGASPLAAARALAKRKEARRQLLDDSGHRCVHEAHEKPQYCDAFRGCDEPQHWSTKA
jgi:hypothetical protein